MTRRNENHGLSGCVGWAHCQDCGGVCSTDDSRDPLREREPCPEPRLQPGHIALPPWSRLCACGHYMQAHQK